MGIRNTIRAGLVGLLLTGATLAFAEDPSIGAMKAVARGTQNLGIQSGNVKQYLEGVQAENNAQNLDWAMGASARHDRRQMEEASKNDSGEETQFEALRRSGIINDKGKLNIAPMDPRDHIGFCSSYQDKDGSKRFNLVEEAVGESDVFTTADNIYVFFKIHGHWTGWTSYNGKPGFFAQLVRTDRIVRNTRDGQEISERESKIYKKQIRVEYDGEIFKVLTYKPGELRPGKYTLLLWGGSSFDFDGMFRPEKTFQVIKAEETPKKQADNPAVKPLSREDYTEAKKIRFE